jgi:hypothetical protein
MAKSISQLSAVAAAASDLLEIARASATVTITATTISAAAADNSYNDSAAGFVAAGFAVGQRVRVQGFTGNVANNVFSAVITAMTAAKMTIGGVDGDVIVDDAAGESVTITAWASGRTTVQELIRPPSSSPGFSATPTLDTDAAEVFYLTLTGNVTDLEFIGTRSKVIVVFTQDGTGGHTVAAGSSISFGTDIPDLTGLAAGANAVTAVGFVYHPATSTFRVVALSK